VGGAGVAVRKAEIVKRAGGSGRIIGPCIRERVRELAAALNRGLLQRESGERDLHDPVGVIAAS